MRGLNLHKGGGNKRRRYQHNLPFPGGRGLRGRGKKLWSAASASLPQQQRRRYQHNLPFPGGRGLRGRGKKLWSATSASLPQQQRRRYQHNLPFPGGRGLRGRGKRLWSAASVSLPQQHGVTGVTGRCYGLSYSKSLDTIHASYIIGKAKCGRLRSGDFELKDIKPTS